jgi:hypothetical protein
MGRGKRIRIVSEVPDYRVRTGSRVFGPFKADRLADLFLDGKLDSDAMVCRSGETEWVAWSDVPELSGVGAVGTPESTGVPVTRRPPAVPPPILSDSTDSYRLSDSPGPSGLLPGRGSPPMQGSVPPVFGGVDGTNGRRPPSHTPHAGPGYHESSPGVDDFDQKQEWRREASVMGLRSEQLLLVGVGGVVALMLVAAVGVVVWKYADKSEKTEIVQTGGGATTEPWKDQTASITDEPKNKSSDFAKPNPVTRKKKKNNKRDRRPEDPKPKPVDPKPTPKTADPKPEEKTLIADTRLKLSGPYKGASPVNLVIGATGLASTTNEGYLDKETDNITAYGPIVAFVRKSTGKSTTLTFKETVSASKVPTELGSLTINANSRKLNCEFKGDPLNQKKVEAALRLSCIKVSSPKGPSKCFVIDLSNKAKNEGRISGWDESRNWIAPVDRQQLNRFMASKSAESIALTFCVEPIALHDLKQGGGSTKKQTRGKLSQDRKTWNLNEFEITLTGLRMKWDGIPTKIEVKPKSGSKQLSHADITKLRAMGNLLRNINNALKIRNLAEKGYFKYIPGRAEARAQQLLVFVRSGISLRKTVFTDNLGSKVCKDQNRPFVGPGAIRVAEAELYLAALNALRLAIKNKCDKGPTGIDPDMFKTSTLECNVFLEYERDGVVVRVPYRIPK